MLKHLGVLFLWPGMHLAYSIILHIAHFSRCYGYNTTRYVGPTSRIKCWTYSTPVTQPSSVREKHLAQFFCSVTTVLQFRYRIRTAHNWLDLNIFTVSAFMRIGFSSFRRACQMTCKVTRVLQAGQDRRAGGNPRVPYAWNLKMPHSRVRTGMFRPWACR